MMIRRHVLINLTTICVAIEVFIRVCFLKDDMQSVEGFFKNEQVMEEVAYTWFNRFSALRFMEVNG